MSAAIAEGDVADTAMKLVGPFHVWYFGGSKSECHVQNIDDGTIFIFLAAADVVVGAENHARALVLSIVDADDVGDVGIAQSGKIKAIGADIAWTGENFGRA